MTFGLGANADDIEALPEPQLKELIASRFRVFADESFTVNDFDIYRTHWRHDPNFGGTYSYLRITTDTEHYAAMAKPIFNCSWHFCGEHTHCNFRGSVHGAYFSGLDSADAILRNLNEHNWEYKGKQKDSSD
jgi:monoamine oxidase